MLFVLLSGLRALIQLSALESGQSCSNKLVYEAEDPSVSNRRMSFVSNNHEVGLRRKVRF